MRKRFMFIAACTLLFVALPAWAQQKDLKAALVAQPVQRKVADFVDYTGRISPRISVVIQPRVTGYRTKMNLEEDVLFEIDDPYVSALNAATAKWRAAECQLEVAQQQHAASHLSYPLTNIVFQS